MRNRWASAAKRIGNSLAEAAAWELVKALGGSAIVGSVVGLVGWLWAHNAALTGFLFAGVGLLSLGVMGDRMSRRRKPISHSPAQPPVQPRAASVHRRGPLLRNNRS